MQKPETCKDKRAFKTILKSDLTRSIYTKKIENEFTFSCVTKKKQENTPVFPRKV